MCSALSTVVTTISPPMASEHIVLDVVGIDGILNDEDSYAGVPLVIKGPCTGDKLTWRVYLELAKKSLRVKVEVAVSGFEGMKCTSDIVMTRGGRKYYGRTHQFGSENSEQIFQDLFNRADCYVVPGNISKGGLLRISININIVFGAVDSTPSENSDISKRLTALESHLCKAIDESADCCSDLLNDPMYSDVVIKCEDQIFPAHKIILALKSSVFAKMFESTIKEAISHEVMVENVKPSTVEYMLKYLYTRKIVRSDDIDLVELLYCADKYDIGTLKTTSLWLMKSALSEENAGEFNVAVQKHCFEDEDTKSFFKTYCREKHSSLMENEAYKKIFIENVQLFV